MDVTDAVKSWRDLEKRRAILKDSHVGSFAVIGLCLLMLSQFAFFLPPPKGRISGFCCLSRRSAGVARRWR